MRWPFTIAAKSAHAGAATRIAGGCPRAHDTEQIVEAVERPLGGERGHDVVGERIAGGAPAVEHGLRVRRQVLEVAESRPDVQWRQDHA
jgi:hypothetical protein